MKKENKEMLNLILMSTLEVKEEFCEDCNFDETDAWDSISHMMIITQLEQQFETKIEESIILDLLSYDEIKKWIETLEKNEKIL